jgi:hypothetical protein
MTTDVFPVNLASRWHDGRQREHEDNDEFSDCWCCCIYCEINNPFYEAAMDHLRGKR